MKEAPWYFPAKNSGKLSPVQGLEGQSYWQVEGKRGGYFPKHETFTLTMFSKWNISPYRLYLTFPKNVITSAANPVLNEQPTLFLPNRK